VKVSPYGAPQDGLQLSITLLGTKTGAKRVVTELIQEARKHAIAKDKSKTVVYVGDEVYPCAFIQKRVSLTLPMLSVWQLGENNNPPYPPHELCDLSRWSCRETS